MPAVVLKGCDPAEDGFHQIFGVAPMLWADEYRQAASDGLIGDALEDHALILHGGFVLLEST